MYDAFCLINISEPSSSESEGNKSHGIVLFKEWFPPLLPPPSSRQNSLISQPPSPTTSIVPTLLQPPSNQPPLVFAREPLQSPEGGVIVLTDSPLASNYNNIFENQIRSVYYPNNHIKVFNNISNVCTIDPHIYVSTVFVFIHASFSDTNKKSSRTQNIL